MNGSPTKMGTISGTAGHSSALKMKKESMAKMYKDSPMDKALVGDQDNLPEHLKAKIEAAPGKMYDSPAKQKAAPVKSHTKEHTTTYEEAYYGHGPSSWKDYSKMTAKSKANQKKYGTYEKYKKAAVDWNMKTYGTKNPTSAANKANMTKKEYAAKYKASKTKAEKTTTVATPPTSQKTVPASDATKRKEGVKRDSIVKDENKDGNMLTRGINKLKQGSKKRKAKQIEKSKGTKYEGMTNFQKRQAIRAEKRKAK